jgi:hypothetical protein
MTVILLSFGVRFIKFCSLKFSFAILTTFKGIFSIKFCESTPWVHIHKTLSKVLEIVRKDF